MPILAEVPLIVWPIALALALLALMFAVRAARQRSTREASAKSEANRLAVDLAEITSKHDAMRERFKAVDDVEAEVRKVRTDADRELTSIKSQIASTSSDLVLLKESYAAKRSIYDALSQQVSIYEEKLDLAEQGVYQRHFEFDDSETYKDQIESLRDKQKAMVSAKTAVTCSTKWEVSGSASKGKTMSDRAVRLTLRAFNNECEAAIANVRWNNATAMEKRIVAAREQINKANETLTVVISSEYSNLKLRELWASHEYREKQKEEKEERAELARAAREEQKLLRDIEDAEKEEAKYTKLLDRARDEAAKATGARLDAYSSQIAILERDLTEARAKAERAQAMAEMTRSGYVYVISNIGSFGPEMVKIGLTRRLDPADRIRELGDASVPFIFDTHAMIYSENAPGLERALHGKFEATRVNALNSRKEFFRVGIDEVEQAVKELAPEASFFRDVEAQEYRETMAARTASLQQKIRTVSPFPDSL